MDESNLEWLKELQFDRAVAAVALAEAYSKRLFHANADASYVAELQAKLGRAHEAYKRAKTKLENELESYERD